MDCRELEDRLEALLDGALAADERRCCERHLERCARCRELLAPFDLAVTPPDGLVGAVLASTSGSPCGRSESLLGAWLDGELSAPEGELMAAHLGGCPDCRALATTMTRLTAELPRLAELRPDAGFTAAVLARTLPRAVRLRRWWRASWPQWVRRPRFASETAFIATIVVALVFATPGSPVAAVPAKALVLVRTNPAERLEAPVAALGKSLTARVKEPLEARVGGAEAQVLAWAREAGDRGESLGAGVGRWFGTSFGWVASLFGSAPEKASDAEDAASNPTQETP